MLFDAPEPLHLTPWGRVVLGAWAACELAFLVLSVFVAWRK